MVGASAMQSASIVQWSPEVPVYLHNEPVDFRKAINGLSAVVEEAFDGSPFDRAIYVFCNRHRTQLKVLYWDHNGFALWQKRLEQDRFTWPKQYSQPTLSLSHEQWNWLLSGVNWLQIKAHKPLYYKAIG